MPKGNVGKVHVFRLSEGEDLGDAIKKRAEESMIKAGMFILIGSLKEAVLGFYKNGQYYPKRIDGPLEIASCMGNIAIDENGETIIHAHIVVSNEKCEAFGGHLMKNSIVGATAELIIIELKNMTLQRTFDEKTKLKLLKLS
ncbi:MAG: PPC domain-containing DNA-binding protein [Candidatus Bathyarchaeales archaeon]